MGMGKRCVDPVSVELTNNTVRASEVLEVRNYHNGAHRLHYTIKLCSTI